MHRTDGEVLTDVHRRLVAELAQNAAGGRVLIRVGAGVTTAGSSKAAAYIIREGDTPSSLAAKEYGDGRMCTRIYAANRDRLPSLDVLLKGQRLVIPK